METAALHCIEKRRLEEQTRLDGLKTAVQRNKAGQFATPPALALSIARHACDLMGGTSPLRFLDPAIGTGSFFSALAHIVPPERIAAATGIEIDPLFAETSRSSGLSAAFTSSRPISRGSVRRGNALTSSSPTRPMCGIITCPRRRRIA